MQHYKDNLDQSFEAFETSFSINKPVLKKSISTGSLNNNHRIINNNVDSNYLKSLKDKPTHPNLTRHSMCNMSYNSHKNTNQNNIKEDNASQSHQLFEPRHNYQIESNHQDMNEVNNSAKSRMNPNLKLGGCTSMLRK